MNHEQFEELGERLRNIGHHRRILAEQIFAGVKNGEPCRDLVSKLSRVSDEAIHIINQ
ncbi:MAG: hypothetical protein ACOX7U_06250 [Desulfitobacteriia bacterium]